MAVTLTLQEYLTYFLLKSEPSDCKTDLKCSTQSLLLATVYKSESGGCENVIYNRRIIGGKNVDPVSQFVVDMTGNTGNATVNGGNLSRTTSMLDVSGEETQLPTHSSISIELLASRSPSKIGSEELQRLLDHCKRNSIKVSISFTFGHPFSWDNKYNKEGMQKLHERGVKLKPLSFQQVLNMMVGDLQDTLESLDDLQTCRGTININYYMLRRAVAKFRDALIVKSDFYFQDNEEKLKEILGYQNGLPLYKDGKEQHDDLTSFSLPTYRDYFFLQNTDEIWAKLKVTLNKMKRGVNQEESLFDCIYNSAEPKQEKKLKNTNGDRNPLGKQQIVDLAERIWKAVGDNVTLHEISSHDEITVSISSVISEYPDRLGWHEALRTLHSHLVGKVQDMEMKKVSVESSIRYAMNISTDQSASTSGRSTPSLSSGQSSKVEADRDHTSVRVECMHVQDMLFDMLEDLEDNLKRLGRIDYKRGANLQVDKAAVASALGLLNKAIGVRTEDGEVHSMNSDFLDLYANEVNQS